MLLMYSFRRGLLNVQF